MCSMRNNEKFLSKAGRFTGFILKVFEIERTRTPGTERSFKWN